MYRLSGSVGQGGRNGHDDVLIVQTLLNKNAHIVEGIGRLPEDGNLDEATKRAIVAFQKDIVRIASPDGRVDPNGRTFRILTGDAPHGATVAFVQLAGNGVGYYLYENADRVWGTPSSIEAVRNVCETVSKLGFVIGVGDISHPQGGKMSPHKSHTRGIDVDIRPQRTDGERLPTNITAPTYSRENTRAVVNELMKRDDIQFIFFNDNAITGVRFCEGHHNHLHIRFKK